MMPPQRALALASLVAAACAHQAPIGRGGEAPEPPRYAVFCRPALGCLRYEARGRARRAAGRIVNAAVVLSSFGFDERIDELWPGLIGPGRALDPEERYIVGVAAQGEPSPGPADFLRLLRALVDEMKLDRGVPLLGASSYGAELALRALAGGLFTGPMLVCGGHDRPFEEPAMQRMHAAVAPLASSASAEHPQAWREVASLLVPMSYGPGYLADEKNAAAHGLVREAAERGLERALVDQLAAHFATHVALAALRRRMDAAFELATQALVYPPLRGRRLIVVANREDQLMSVAGMRALAARLRAAGGAVALYELSDPLGHSAFFRHVPVELETAVRALLSAPVDERTRGKARSRRDTSPASSPRRSAPALSRTCSTVAARGISKHPAAKEERERHLVHGGPVLLAHLGERRELIRLRAARRKIGERTVAGDRDLVRAAVRQDLLFDVPVAEVVLHLIAADARARQRGLGLDQHRWRLEVADPDRPHLAARPQRLERAHGLRERVTRRRQVQEVQVEMIGPQPPQAGLRGAQGALVAGMVRADLAGEKDLVATAGDGLADERLCAPVPVDLGGVDVAEAEIEPETDRAQLLVAASGIFA